MMCLSNLTRAITLALCSMATIAFAGPASGQQYSAQRTYRAPNNNLNQRNPVQGSPTQGSPTQRNSNQMMAPPNSGGNYQQMAPNQQMPPQRFAQAPNNSSSQGAPSMSNRYVPRHLRTASTQTVIPDGGTYNQPSNVGTLPMGPGPTTQNGQYIDHSFGGGEVIGNHAVDGGYSEGGYGGGYIDGGYGDGGYGGGYIDGGCDGSCGGGCDDCMGGGCLPPNDCRDCQIDEDCWATGLGGLLYNAEYFAGAHAFTSPGLLRTDNGFESNSSFGLHAGFNIGLPLRKLTCGLVSGQFGARSVQSNFNGNPISSDSREQTFVTAGLFRRVDAGLQFGVVADVLHEEWISELDLVQIRGDISWAWSGGSQAGIRFTDGVQNNTDLNIPGFGNVNGSVFDTYRFYYHHACECGGYNEFYVGWSDDNHTVVGMDYDLPLNYKWALRSGFTYLIPEESQNANARGNPNESWNVSVGLVWRPRARNWYRWYHRPLLPVADNGSMIIRRQTN